MDFDFTKLQEAASSLAQKAVQGVNFVARKGKATYDRFTLENELSKAQRQLGAYYYNQVKMGVDHESAVAECIAKIDSILDRLNEMEDDGDAAAETPETECCEGVCPECGAPMAENALFCSQCGAKR